MRQGMTCVHAQLSLPHTKNLLNNSSSLIVLAPAFRVRFELSYLVFSANND